MQNIRAHSVLKDYATLHKTHVHKHFTTWVLKGILTCETQLAITVKRLQKGLDDKQQIDVIILDFQKAFDKVPHRHLLNKLRESGLDRI